MTQNDSDTGCRQTGVGNMKLIARNSRAMAGIGCVLWIFCLTILLGRHSSGQDASTIRNLLRSGLTPEEANAIIEQAAEARARDSIDFGVWATNDYTSTATADLQIEARRGVPGMFAILVDSTNFSEATWSAYTSSNLVVDLGSREGWHEIRVGLRAANDPMPTWVWKRLKLDRTPPAIVITNPTNHAVSQPMIQLHGYSPEDLSSISCDLSNAAGFFSDRMILVLNRYYDPKTSEFTTNRFQAFDLRLTTNLNTITIRAVDQAGNSTTTNFDIMLASASVAPVVQLWWPQDGAELCGDTFTWRGKVDDFTAKLTATIVNASGRTNVSTAEVERDGKFWFEGLPLADGTNALMLTAVDFWGNVAATNISVSKSAVQLTIDPVDVDALSNATITVTGTINVSDHTVWVNGVKTTLNVDGTWTARDVPVTPGNTAVIQARAIPNTDNGGNGTGGSGGSGATMQNPGNPTSPYQKDAGGHGT
jgi:hypothetical protein